MALRRATKSIPLSGGISTDVPEVLLDPPGMAMIENARFRKKDYAEKTQPLRVFPVGKTTGASDFYPIPKVCWANEHEVVTVGRNEVCKLRAGASDWATVPVISDLSGMELTGASTPIAGGTHFTWCWIITMPIGYLDVYTKVGFAIACQRRTHNETDATGDVVLQIFDMNANMVSETNFGEGSMPQLQSTGWGAVLYFVTNNRTKGYSIEYADFSLLLRTIGTQDLYQTNQYYDDAAGTWNALVSHDALRIGHTMNARLMNHAMKYRQRVNKQGVVATKRATGTIHVTLTNGATGASTGTDWLVATDVAGTAMNKLLDVEVSFDAGLAYVLYSTADVTTPSACVVKIAKVNMTTGAISLWTQPLTTNYGIVFNGSLVLHGNNKITYAVSRMGDQTSSPSPEDRFNQSGMHIEWAVVSASWVTGTEITRGAIWDHKLTSRIEVDKFDSPCCLVEQFGSFEPTEDTDAAVADPKKPSITPAAVKPVTTVFIKLEDTSTTSLPPDGTGDREVVLASLDAGQSKHLDASYAENCIHLLDIWYENQIKEVVGGTANNHEWWLGNRNILGLEDFYAYVTDDVGPVYSHSRYSLLLGDARGTIWHKAANIPVHAAKFDNGFAMNCGVPVWYDGSFISEMAPLDQPEILGLVGSPAGANVTHISYNSLGTDNEHTVVAVVGFYDQQGVVHRSAPSFPIYVGAADAASYVAAGSIRLYARVTKPLTIYHGERRYFIEIYACLAGGTPQLAVTYEYPTEHTAPGAGNTGNIHFPFLLGPENPAAVKDVVRGSKVLYTEGDVLAADAWPQWTCTTRTARRMFGVSASDPETVYYSKIFESGVIPEFSASLTISLGAGRKITAIGSVDDKVLLFERSGITILYGSGPDNTGANGDFITEKMNTMLGCEDQDSILTIPDGIAFYSSITKGFHLVTRDMQIVDIGAPLQEFGLFDGFDIRDALVYPAESEARWYVEAQSVGEGEPEYGPTPSTGTGYKERPPRTRFTRRLPTLASCLCYNYAYGKWTILTNQDLHRVALFENRPVGIRDTWVAYETVVDNDLSQYNAWEAMSWETPWIRVNQLQDYGRFYGLEILGRFLNSWTLQGSNLESSDLQVTLSYDYEGPDGATDTYRFRANQDFDPDNGERLQLKIRPRRQKCQAIKITIDEIATSKIEVSEPNYTMGRGYELTAVDILYGAKGGSSRLPAWRKK